MMVRIRGELIMTGKAIELGTFLGRRYVPLHALRGVRAQEARTCGQPTRFEGLLKRMRVDDWLVVLRDRITKASMGGHFQQTLTMTHVKQWKGGHATLLFALIGKQ